VKEKVKDILEMLLNQKVNEDISMENCDAWDSMKHIEIIMTLEDELDVSFNVEDIPHLTSMVKILEKL